MKPIRAVVTTYEPLKVQRVNKIAEDAMHFVAHVDKTIVKAYVEKDESGFIQVSRDGVVVHRFEFERDI